MYLHKDDRELFRDIIVTVSEKSGFEENIVEKDYYVTMLLKELVKKNPAIVFKGGTSLSKAYGIIERFSEDIDITFTEHIGESRRKKLKYKVMKLISEELELPIANWDEIESDKDYNHYDFVYEKVTSFDWSALKPYVKLETALMSCSCPTEERQITSIIYDYLKDTDPDIIEEFDLLPFNMQVQSMVRTFIDKMFAVCDYYMIGKATRNSRHLYDIYKMLPYIEMNEEFYKLVAEVRKYRAGMNIKITPSAREDVDIIQVVNEITESDFYSDDYEDSTKKLINDEVTYEDAIQCYMQVMKSIFEAGVKTVVLKREKKEKRPAKAVNKGGTDYKHPNLRHKKML